jgi:protein-tyrosine phosphatase
VKEDDAPPFLHAAKQKLKRLVPGSLLEQRQIVLRLGPAGRTYASLRFLDAVGIRTPNERLAPQETRSFLFVCFGNIMRSALAEVLMKQALCETGHEPEVRILSAGLHATIGNPAHRWAQQAASDLGVSLADHRARLLSPEMVEQSDAILAMDFQNKAELLTLYPAHAEKIFMLSAYAEGDLRCRQIEDPYFTNLDGTLLCGRQIQTCIRNLILAIFASSRETKRETDQTPGR